MDTPRETVLSSCILIIYDCILLGHLYLGEQHNEHSMHESALCLVYIYRFWLYCFLYCIFVIFVYLYLFLLFCSDSLIWISIFIWYTHYSRFVSRLFGLVWFLDFLWFNAHLNLDNQTRLSTYNNKCHKNQSVIVNKPLLINAWRGHDAIHTVYTLCYFIWQPFQASAHRCISHIASLLASLTSSFPNGQLDNMSHVLPGRTVLHSASLSAH